MIFLVRIKFQLERQIEFIPRNRLSYFLKINQKINEKVESKVYPG